ECRQYGTRAFLRASSDCKSLPSKRVSQPQMAKERREALNLSSFCEVVRSILLQCKAQAGIPMSRSKGWLSQQARASIATAQRIRWERWRVRKRQASGSA